MALFSGFSFRALSTSPCSSRGPVAQWITRLTTDQKIPGSNPGRIGCFWPDNMSVCDRLLTSVFHTAILDRCISRGKLGVDHCRTLTMKVVTRCDLIIARFLWVNRVSVCVLLLSYFALRPWSGVIFRTATFVRRRIPAEAIIRYHYFPIPLAQILTRSHLRSYTLYPDLSGRSALTV